MKRLLYLSLILLNLFFVQACQESESLVVNQKGDLVEIRFDLDIQEESLSTRNSSSKELHLFVFDGLGQGRNHYVLGSNPGNSFRLPRLNDSAIIHFIWVESGFDQDIESVFSSEEFIGMHEGEAINAISSTRELFWARVEVPSLIQNTNLGKIVLLRNQARVSVRNQTAKINRFDILGFAIHNIPTHGTIAPFNCETAKFEHGVITESYPRRRIPIAPMDDSENLLVSENQVQFFSTSQSIDLFERAKASADDDVFLIIKAKYKGKVNYYKLGFYDSKQLIRIGLERNNHYVVNITEVAQAGYKSLQEAISNAPAENAGLSILLEEYTQISNGKSSLTVSSTALSFHNAYEKMEVTYTYVDKDKSADIKPEIELIQTDGQEVINPSSFTFTHTYNRSKREHSGVISGITSDNLPQKHANAAVVRVRFGDLVRDVRIDLGPMKELNAKIISLGNRVDDRVYIEFTINSNDILSNSIFPLNFNIDTHFLYPDTESGYNSNLSIVYNEHNEHYHYQYTANEIGVHRIYFKRNLSYKSEVVRLKSNHYITQDLNLIGGDYIEPFIVNGSIYIGQNQNEELDQSARVWGEPADMPRSFWLPRTGEYSFQFDKKRAYTNEEFKLYAETKDGRSYRATYPFKYFLGYKPKVVLQSYTMSSIVYAYYGQGTNQVLDVRAYYLSCSHPNVNVKLNTDDIYKVNALDISLTSDIADDEELTFYATYKNGWNSVLYKAVTTAKKVKRNQGLDFVYAR